MKPTRSLSLIAAGYTGVLTCFAIAPSLGWMRIDGLFNFALGGLAVGMAATLAALGDRVRVNRRLLRMTAPLAERVRKDFEPVSRPTQSADEIAGGIRPIAQGIRDAIAD
ncbi:MAG: hypothetical protein RSP_04790 [Rhodanobacter sp.]